ncbi:MAG: hypothetical protein JWM68_1084 [Verrucomicrobiales bacterium]|nr:hypothetical protein [Verrucomicrobiales bacterium]
MIGGNQDWFPSLFAKLFLDPNFMIIRVCGKFQWQYPRVTDSQLLQIDSGKDDFHVVPN